MPPSCGPEPSQSRTGHGLLHRNGDQAPCADCWRGMVGLQTHQFSHEVAGLSVPAAAHLRTRARRVSAARASSGYAASLRRSATRITAPSTVAALGCGFPERVSGDTSVALQHCAPPLLIAPYTTRFRDDLAFRSHRFPGDPHSRTLHDLGPPGGESRARARKCLIAEAIYFPAAAMRRPAGAAMQGQRSSQATPQGDLHSVRWMCSRRISQDRSKPRACLRSSLGSQERLGTGWHVRQKHVLAEVCVESTRPVPCTCQPYGQSFGPASSGGGGRAPPTGCATLCRFANPLLAEAPSPPLPGGGLGQPGLHQPLTLEGSCARSRACGLASLAARPPTAQYAAGAVRSADCMPSPPSTSGMAIGQA